MIPLINSEDCEKHLRSIWEDDTSHLQESVYAVYLDSKGVRIFSVRLALGRFSKCDPDIYLIMHYARSVHSQHVVLAHNHPCGSPLPSDGDIAFTNDVLFALALCDIKLVDHIVLTKNNYFSFKDHKLLEHKRSA